MHGYGKRFAARRMALLLGTSALALATPALGAVIDYPDGSDNTSPIVLTDSSTQLQVLSGSATQSGEISEAGFNSGFGLEKTGSGTLVFTGGNIFGQNNYTGTTTISAGTLQIGNGGASGFLAGPVTNNGMLVFDLSSQEFSTQISGTGGVVQNGTGTIILQGVNTYTGGTTINHGTLQIGYYDFDSSVQGDIVDNASLRLVRAGGYTFSNKVTGTGSLTQAGGGFVVLTNDNTYAGGTIATAGWIKIGDGGTHGSIQGDILTGPGGKVSFNHSDTYIFAGDASAASGFGGALEQAGTGTLILTGDTVLQSNMGVVISSGVLQIGNGGATGSVIGGINNNSSLVLNRSDDSIFDATVNGTGSVTLIGSGTVTLLNIFEHTGGTTISNGALRIGNGGTSGSIAGNILNSTSLTFDRSDTLSYTGVISGSGTVTQAGAGTLILTGENTYSGGTTVSSGTLQIGNGTSGGISGNVADNGTLIFNRSDSVTFSGVISGTGSLTQAGAGTLILTGSNTYSGGTIISSGAISIGSDAALGTGTITMGGGTLIFTPGFTTTRNYDVEAGGGTFSAGPPGVSAPGQQLTMGGVISGSGAVTFTGFGGTTLTGNNTYTGGTTIYEGAIQVGDGATSGAIVGDVVSGVATANAGINFFRSDDIVFSGNISGLGYVAQQGTGTLTLAGDNSYAGETTVLQGTLAFANDGNLGAGVIKVYNAGLRFDGSFNSAKNYQILDAKLDTRVNTVTLAGLVGDLGRPGSITKMGAGTLILSNLDTYTGATTVDGGILSVTGSIAASSGVTVHNGATLGGTGTVPTTLVQSGGALAPGNSIGTLTVDGDLTLQPGATYAVEVSPSSADKTLVSGNASLAGNLSANFATGSGYGPATYTLLSAAGTLSGTFSSFDTQSVPTGYRAEISYGAHDVLLDLIVNRFVWSADPGSNAWSSGANWTYGQAAGAGDTAEFAASSTTHVSITGTAAANTIQLDSGAPAYSFAITGGAAGVASLTLSGGITQLTGNNASFTASGGAGNGGTLAFTGSGNAAGSILTAASSGIVSFAGNTDAGAGAQLVAASGGVVDFAATSGAAGDHQVSAGSIAGAGNFVLGANTLTVGALGTSTEVSGVISGSGGLIKTGGGTLTLSGASTYTGATRVDAGVLDINGSLASSSVALNGGTLKGHGRLGGVAVADGATVAPGNSIGTLNTGTISFAAGSTYQVETDAAGHSDLIDVTGTASLNGTVQVLAAAGTYAPVTTYRILNAGSISGSFTGVTTADAFAPSLAYGATSVDLTLRRNNVVFGSEYGATANQVAAGNAVSAAGARSSLYEALANAYAPATITATLASVSGEIHASLRSAMIEDSRMIRDGVLGRLAAGGTGVWGHAFADYGELDGDGNAAGLHRGSAGFIAGLDLPLAEGLRAGIAGAYAVQHVSVTARASRAGGDAGYVIGYAGWQDDRWQVALGGDYGWGGNDISRVVAALGEVERASPDSEGGQAFARISYDPRLSGLPLVPYFGLAHVAVHTGAFVETGGLAVLSGAGKTDTQTYTALGLRLAERELSLAAMDFGIHADLGWSHALEGRTPSQTLAFATGRDFAVLGAPVGSDAATIQLGFDLAIASTGSLSIGYDGSFSDSSFSHAIRGGLEWPL
jgi:autotransporter-associated beta strand protein